MPILLQLQRVRFNHRKYLQKMHILYDWKIEFPINPDWPEKKWTESKTNFFSGAKWEWSSSALTGSTGSNTSNSEWHIYDMEVQTVIEESWAMGEQTIDIGQHFPGCPYIINFCNLTQVRRTTGVVRPIRRQPCASYPMVSAIHSATGNQRFCFQSKKVANDLTT